jgi:hypothetical protein
MSTRKRRPAGYIIDVPVTLSVAVRGKTREEAFAIARAFAEALNPSEDFIRGYCDEIGAGTITEATLASSTEDSCEVLEELEQ